MGIISSLLNLGGQALSNWQNYRYTTKTNEQQFEYQKAMQDYAYQQNLLQWERENAYNDPSEQMKRLANAGLNPNLVYGNGATTLSARSPQYKAPDVHMEAPKAMPLQVDFDIMQTIKDIQGSKNMVLQNDLMQQDVISKKVDNAIKIATQDTAIQKQVEELTGLRLTNDGKALDNQGKTYDNVVKFIEAQNKEFAQPFEKMMIQYKTDIMKNQVDLTEAQANEAAARKLLVDVQTAIAETEEEARKQGWSWNDKYYNRHLAESVFNLNNIKIDSFDDLAMFIGQLLQGVLFGLFGLIK